MADHRVAFATCREFPDLSDDDRLVLAPLADLGVQAQGAVWDDPAIDWATYDLVVVRSTWDYVDRRSEFIEWAQCVPRLANPADVLAWNTDKHYMSDLQGAALAVVDTQWFEPGTDDALAPLPWEGMYVVKPAVSASGRDTRRHDLGTRMGRSSAQTHLARLTRAGRTAMLQPYLDAVDTYGETSLLFLGGAFSHATRKAAVLPGESTVAVSAGDETITPRTPRKDEIDVATRALACVPGGAAQLLYARVDLIDGPDGSPLILEIELTEPSLFLRMDGSAPARFAASIDAWIP